MATPDFVMVPIASGGPTKPTTSYQSIQSQPMAKPSTVSVPKSKTVPGTGISIMKDEKEAEDEPLSVETSPANGGINMNDCAKITGNVETKGSDNSTEHVATEKNTVNFQVETAHCIQNTVHVETPSPEEISTHPSIPQAQEVNSIDAEPSASGTTTLVNSSNTGENGAVSGAADSSMDIEKDTSMQNLISPKTPVTYLDDEVKTDAYSDDETIPMKDNDTQIPVVNVKDTDTGEDTDNDAQIPIVNVKDTDTGNNTVEISTEPSNSLDKITKPTEADNKSIVLKIQPLNNIEIDIWSNMVGDYYKFKAVSTPLNSKKSPVLPAINESDGQSLSHRGRKDVDYTSKLTSDLDSEPETDKKKPKKYRPRASGPSALSQLANKHSKSSKIEQNKIPTHSYPIRGYKQHIKATNEIPDSPLPQETGLSVDMESSQVEMTDLPEQVETTDSTSHMETDSPI